MNRSIGALLFAFFFLTVPCALYSQSYLTKTYSISDGLDSPTINAMDQDPGGLMWFATAKGITSYDGTRWVNYSKSDGLDFETYYHLKIDGKSTIRAFTRYLGMGFSCFSKGEWGHVNGPPGIAGRMLPITALAQLETGGKLFIGIGTVENGFYIYKNPGWLHFSGDHGPGFNSIRSIATYGNSFYLATEKGLRVLSPLEPGGGTLKTLNTPSPTIYSIAVSPLNPGIWLTGKNWIGIYRENRFHLVFRGQIPAFRWKDDNHRVITLADHFGGLWLGNRITLLHFTPDGRLENFILQNDLPVGGIYSLFYDRESNFWAGGFRGVSKIVNFSFANFTRQHGLYDNEVTAVAEFDNGELILGHNGGFSLLGRKGTAAIEIPGADSSTPAYWRVLDLRKDRDGNVWGAVNGVGIVRIDPSHRMTWYKARKIDTPDPHYTSVLPDDSGNIWATAQFQLLKRNGNDFIPVKTDTTVESLLRRLFKGRDGAIYIATFGAGIYRFHQDKLTRIQCPRPGKCNSTYAVFTDKQDTVWVGTDAGLYTVNKNNNTLEPYSTGSVLGRNPIYFITGDPDGNLWIGLDMGVIRWNRGKREMRHFTSLNGLVGNETNRAAGFVDSRGLVWIGTARGLSRYDKKKDLKKTIPPLLELLYVDASGFKLPLDNPVSLEYHQNDLTFHFRGISFRDESALRYRLKLEGYDTQWIRNFKTVNNQVRYTNLSPGDYTFHVQAVSGSGAAGDIVSSSRITIKSPFWGAWWFYLITFPLLVVFLSAFERYISKKRYASRLEEQVRQRTEQLEASENEFKNIFEHAHDAIIIFSPASEIILDVNQRACEIYGFPREEFIGMSLQSISQNVSRGREKLREVLQRGRYINFETVQYKKNGQKMLLEINASVIDYGGKSAILTVNRDISERRRAEQQIKTSLKEKEVLLKEIHHRVKNNLQIILSLLDLQAESLENPEILRVFQDTKDRIRSMALIHENLFRSEELGRIDIGDYVGKLVDYFWGLYGGVGVSITPELQVENVSLGIDSALPIGLILSELISNSLKYAFPDGRRGIIDIQLHKTGYGKLTLAYRDNGIGFPDGVDFYNSRSLGLQLVNLLADQVNGTVEFSGDRGVFFKLTFPFKSPRVLAGTPDPAQKNSQRERKE